MEINRPLRFLFVLLLHLCGSSVYSQSLSVPTTLTATLTTNSPEVLRNIVTDIDPYTGKQVYVWGELDDTPAGATTKDIYCAIYDKDQNVLVPKFRINTFTTGDQAQQRVRINPNDGSFVVAWGSLNVNWDVFAKKINLNISATEVANVIATADTPVNTNATLKPNTQYYPLPVFCEISGELLIGFTGVGSNGTNEVYYQRLTYPGMAIVNGAVEQQLNTVITGQQNLVEMEYSTFSNQVIASYHSNSGANGYDVIRRIISYSEATGTYSTDAETTVNTSAPGDQQNGHVAINQTTGNYSITWSSSTGWKVFSKIYNASNAMIKDEFSVLGAQTSASELGGRSVWDESSNVLILFWHNYASATNYWYSMVDGNSLTYITGSETQITSAGNTKAGYSQYYYPAYNKLSHKIALAYDVLDGLGGSIGYSANFTYAHPSFNPVLSTNDPTMNWTDTKVFNGYGDITGESRNYFDNFGKIIQSQVLNPQDKTITEQMPLYDYLDRPAIQSLPAPLEKTVFSYDRLFMSRISEHNDLIPYLPMDFDDPSTINNPKTLTSSYGLGQYYNLNRQIGSIFEPTIPETSFPYSRQIYNDNAPGGVIKQTLPGNAHRAGLGHEMRTITLPVLDELNHYMAIRNANFVTSGTQTTLNCKATKTINTDANGIVTSITFTNQDGQTVATARDCGTYGQAMQVSLAPNMYWLRASVANGTMRATHFQIIGNSDVLIYDTYTQAQIYPLGSTGIPGPIAGFDLTNYSTVGEVQIRSSENFHLKYLDATNIWHYNDVAQYQDGQSGIDLYLQTGHALSLTCSTPNTQIQVVDLTSGNAVYTGTVSGFNASALNGYYRFFYNSINIPFSWAYDDAAHKINFSFTSFYQEYAYFFYDDAGRLIAKTAPLGVNLANTTYSFTDTYSYNGAGQVVSMTETDGGTTSYTYLSDGRLRFSQNAEQAATGKFSFINYDEENRVVKSGEYDKTVSGATLVFQTKYQNWSGNYEPNSIFNILTSVQSNNNGGLGSDTYLSDFNTITYSSVTAYNLTDASNNSIGTRTPRNVWNAASQTTNKAGYSTQYSYDNDYRLEWMAETLPGLGSKTIDYVYDQSNQLLQTIYQKNQSADRYEHINKYDKIGRLISVWTRESTGMMKLQEQDYYYLYGPLKRKEIGTIQGLDYNYTIQGWLKGINSSLAEGIDNGCYFTPSQLCTMAPDVFGMNIDYFDGDYQDRDLFYLSGPNQMTSYGCTEKPGLLGNLYNGSIRSISWLTEGHLNTNSPCQYAFNYDSKYQLTGATFGYEDLSNNNFTPQSTFQMSATYDLNGNLKTKTAVKPATGTESYTYSNITGKNILSTLTMTTAPRQYAYNNIGQMTQQIESNGTGKKVYYTPGGLTSYVTDQSATPKMLVKYEYNERGERAKKISYSSTTGAVTYTTWYVNDGSGNNLSIYDNNGSAVLQKEIPIYGSGRIGICYKNGTALTYTYEIKDHLGSVRATVGRNKTSGGAANILSWGDYLPYGEVMPGRNGGTPAYTDRYGYQGEYAECDVETGWNSFDLRMYDANVGRWLSPDPRGQYYSPYVGMGNNPASSVDPTGGEAWKPDSEGNLIAEEGDNAGTLATYLNVSLNDAQSMINNQSLQSEFVGVPYALNVKSGEHLQLFNNFTQSIQNSNAINTDNYLDGVNITTPADYNCWGSALAGSKGKEIKTGVGVQLGFTFDWELKSHYNSINASEATFGNTVLRFANSKNEVQHGAVFYGKSKDGTIYVYTKNGWYLKPEVMKVTDLQNKIPDYGTVQGVNPSNSGYYQPK